MNRETKTGKAAKGKPKRSPKKAPVKGEDALRDLKKILKTASDPWDYFAKYFDQI